MSSGFERAVLSRSSVVFDRLETAWDTLATQRRVATLLTMVFLAGMLVIELRRQGWLPENLAAHLPDKHFDAILWAFTLLLLAEVISLIFALAKSVATAVGKQLEIMSLILVRQSFKELTKFSEPIEWSDTVRDQVAFILSDAFGALAIFAILVVYARLQRHQPISRDEAERSSFIASKKLIALALLASLVLIAVHVVWSWWAGAHTDSLFNALSNDFFEIFYTLLIFADVLIVLISLRSSITYPVVFRYFGFAVATVLIRLALTAPRF
ncbi:MAG TPA: hypothetical protein VLT32_16735, partial [Candidatus Sulfomarinibacteraceae bacterium]|nr:hypothetical protein [Candidatus Sulfomarinibacteraceae bacterium]